jgi:tetratricopeptide (TPR) repeat protein
MTTARSFICRRRGHESQTKRSETPYVVSYRALVCFIALFCTVKIFAADLSSDFDSANKLYAEGKFAAAAAAYDKILQTGTMSPALWFNYGNAEFKLGQPGRAIAAYRRAELLAPRDDEVRANLDFVRNQVTGPTLRASRWQDWLGTLSLNEWTELAASAFWLTLMMLALRQIQPAWRPRLRGLTSGLFVLTILSFAGLAVAATIHFSKPVAVVIDTEATARSGPFTEAQDAFKAQNGAELAVLDHRDNWLQVADGSGRIGWLTVKQVEVLPGA